MPGRELGWFHGVLQSIQMTVCEDVHVPRGRRSGISVGLMAMFEIGPELDTLGLQCHTQRLISIHENVSLELGSNLVQE